MRETKEKHNATGRDYVRAIREVMRRAGANSVGLDPENCRVDPKDIPFIDWGFCRHDRLDTVWLPEALDVEGNGPRPGIGLSGTRDDIQPGVFTGEEACEDFEAIFRAVYTELADSVGSKDSPEKWMEKFLRPKWDFIYDEERYTPDGKLFWAGLLTNGEDYLFWKTDPTENSDDPTLCHIYNSILMTDDSVEMEYLWCSENDERVVNCLNSLDDPKDFCGDDSPLLGIVFVEDEEEGN